MSSAIQVHFPKLGTIMSDIDELNEIICNNWENIWIESQGSLARLPSPFANSEEYEEEIEYFLLQAKRNLNRENPILEFEIDRMRITVVDSELTGSSTAMNIRFNLLGTWPFEATESNLKKEMDLIIERRLNILVIGPTSSGKTSLLQYFLQSSSRTDRTVVIEDTPELRPVHSASIHLRTRPNLSEQLRAITYETLIRTALRLRPDRLMLGEIRGAEAFNFLQALSTGHMGSSCSLHASTANESLLRLEMLIQLGAPQWDLQSIRKLIYLSLQRIVVLGRHGGRSQRKITGIYQISGLEDRGISLEKCYHFEKMPI